MTRSEVLQGFVDWCQKHITGDEKGEAQIFLDRLFQAFEHEGAKEAGALFEERVHKSGGGTAFADLVWKPVVLIEMKKRGEPLQKHYRQAFDYWTRLVPNRPRYVILCNFDEFRVYDFEAQMDEPVDLVKLTELPDRWTALAFLYPGAPTPSFGNARVPVTIQAAESMADLFHRLVKRGVERPHAQRYILQMLVCFIAEDIGLLPKDCVTLLLESCETSADTFDLINGLFAAMNSPKPAQGGRFKDVRYFNGGLFASSAAVELTDTELVKIREISKQDWRKVQPEIFGTLFEASSNQAERRAFGQHFTHPADIMKIIGPTISAPWAELVDKAQTRDQLFQLLDRLQRFRVLDPACGSGNFLYLAYRELKRVEAQLLDRIAECKGEGAHKQLGFLSAQNFYGLDINPFAVEIAKVTMMIARKFAVDELHIHEPDLPLDNLDKNFRAADALLDAAGQPAVWPQADVIIGNPPFIGSRFLSQSHGYDYVRKLYAAYPDVPKMADYCVYWFRKAHDALPPCTPADPAAGRAGLVGTQNIRNNQARIGGLDYIAKTGTIVEAVDNQPWSGEANVHVSIANWVKSQDAVLLADTPRKLWFKVETSAAAKKIRKRGDGPASKDYELNCRECAAISSALSDKLSVDEARVLACNCEPKRVFTGQNPCHEGFSLTLDEAGKMLRDEPACREILFPYMTGLDLVTSGLPQRWIIDFGQRDMLAAARYAAAFEVLKQRVMADVLGKAEKEKLATGKESTRWSRMAERWWQFRDWMPGTVAAVNAHERYIVCPRLMKRPTFAFMSREIHPDMQLMVFPFADDYSLGILQSSSHWLWFVTKCSKMKSDFRYTSESVFDTFPWPQGASVAQIDAVAAAARAVRRIRAEHLPQIKGGLRALYRTLELPGANPLKDAHAALDAAVLAAYGFDAQQDLLAQLLALNLAVAARLDRGEPVTAPGVPAAYPNPAALITEDCIRPAT